MITHHSHNSIHFQFQVYIVWSTEHTYPGISWLERRKLAPSPQHKRLTFEWLDSKTRDLAQIIRHQDPDLVCNVQPSARSLAAAIICRAQLILAEEKKASSFFPFKYFDNISSLSVLNINCVVEVNTPCQDMSVISTERGIFWKPWNQHKTVSL